METIKRLGDLLVDENIINKKQLEEALSVQKNTGKRLGKALVDMGYVTEEDILNILEYQLDINRVDLKRNPPDPKLLHIVPRQLMLRHMVIPYRLSNKTLFVAMTDPLNVVVIDDLTLRTGYNIETLIASEEQIRNIIKKHLGIEQLKGEAGTADETAAVDKDDEAEQPDKLEEEEQAPIIQIVNTIFEQAISAGASDIHLEPRRTDVRVRHRVDGMLRDMMTLPFSAYGAVVSRVKIMARMDIAERRLPQDGRMQLYIEGRDIDVRVSIIPTVYDEKIVLRLLDRSGRLLELEKIGFDDKSLKIYRSLIHRPYGMILVTGPTGSGKSTTLYASLNEINSPEENVVTIEDPVEYVLEDINQISVKPKSGLTFAVGLRSILRQDPDVIMVGEIRDTETASIAVRSATTGHLVLSTLHTNDAPGALTRLVDMGVETYLIASSITGILAQRLVRLNCKECIENYKVTGEDAMGKFAGLQPEETLEVSRGTGCRYCDYTGYRGRTAVFEVMAVDSEIRRMIMRKEPAEVIRNYAEKSDEFIGLKENGLNKVRQGMTTLEEVLRITML